MAPSAAGPQAPPTESSALPPVPRGVRSMQTTNLLLASLSTADAAAIRPNLRPIRLEHQNILHEAGDSIRQVYFPTTAIVSLVVSLSTGETVEAAMVGKDGVVGAAAALDG